MGRSWDKDGSAIVAGVIFLVTIVFGAGFFFSGMSSLPEKVDEIGKEVRSLSTNLDVVRAMVLRQLCRESGEATEVCELDFARTINQSALESSTQFALQMGIPSDSLDWSTLIELSDSYGGALFEDPGWIPHGWYAMEALPVDSRAHPYAMSAAAYLAVPDSASASDLAQALETYLFSVEAYVVGQNLE